MLPPFQLETFGTIIHGRTTLTDAKPLMLTLFTKTYIVAPPEEFLIIKIIVIIYIGTFYLVYFIYISNINDVTVIIFATVIHIRTINIFTTVWQILINVRF